MAVLVTGGAGYIGSHTCISLYEAGYEPIVLDNLSNSKPTALDRVEAIVGKTIPFVEGDVGDAKILAQIFSGHDIEAVIHFAGLKAVGESTEIPLHYFQTNVGGTMTLCSAMASADVSTLLFSSSATVYGDPATVPIREDFPTGATNPYGRSKLIVEEILQDVCGVPGNQWRVGILRYFNPIGAHASGNIGEDPQGIPNNLLPFVAQVAVGKREKLRIFGGDYPTRDGTGIRDYIHVVDLAEGHVAALKRLQQKAAGAEVVNLGTGRGYSVLEVVQAFERVSGKSIPYEIVARRPGDIAECFADPQQAKHLLGWEARFDLDRMVEDAWRWQSQNPNGYGDQ